MRLRHMFRGAFILGVVLLGASAVSAQEAALEKGLAGPSFSKVFAPDTIGPGGVSMLTFTITNDSASVITDLAFTDTLPAGVMLATPANPTTTCLDGVISAPNGGSTITFSDGSVGANGTCTVMVNVTSSTPGTHMNVSGSLTSSAGMGGVATDDLTVDTDLPGFSKSFAPSPLSLGGRSTLTFTIDNSANGSAVNNLDFTDNLPTGMVIANPANASTDCGTALIPPTLIAAAGTTVIVLDADGIGGFPAVGAGVTCTVSVDVKTTGAGMLHNVSGELLADFVTSGKAAASLNVTAETLHLSKDFTDDPVPPGGTVTLEFKITNFDRLNSASAVAFTDDLGAALTGLTFDSLIANDCGGSVAGVGTTMLALTGGTVAAEGSCTIRVSLSVPAGAAPGAYTNTTGAIAGTLDGSPVTGNMASEDLFVESVPLLTKEFLDANTLAPDPMVNPGDDVVIRFTITNTSATSGATDIAFIDELTTFLPLPLSVVLPATPCGAGSSITLVGVGVDGQGLSLADGSLAAAGMSGDSCTFDVTLTIPGDLATGGYVNTTQAITATVDGATRTGAAASDTLNVIAAPSLSKAFTNDPVAPGGTVTLEFTLTHSSNAASPATGISFTDDLAAALTGLTANLPSSPDPPCGAGSSLTGTAGDTLLTLAGGSLDPGESCTFSVTLDVPAGATPGDHTNTTSMVMANVGGSPATSQAAQDDLLVAGLVFSKEFLDNPVLPGATTTLRFTIENVHPTDDATGIFFTDNLAAVIPGSPPDLTATLPPAVNTCGGTESGTATSLLYTGGSLMSGLTCTIEYEILVPAGAADGTYINTTSNLNATLGGSPVTQAPAVDRLTIDSNLLQLTKEFTDDPVKPGDMVTLEFTLTNTSATEAASGIAFTDDLDAALSGLVATGLPVAACGGTISTPDGGSTIEFSGGSLAAAGGACAFSVLVAVPGGAATGDYTNVTSAATGTVGGLAATSDPAIDTLRVRFVSLTKSFGATADIGGTVSLTFTIENLSSTDTVNNLSFTDNLNDTLAGLVATGLPPTPCGAGSTIAGTSFLSLTGGNLLPGGTCTFSIPLQVPASLPGMSLAGLFPNTTSQLFVGGLPVAPPATATLTVTTEITNTATVTATGAAPAQGQTTDTVQPQP